MVTGVPGSSGSFEGGFITYTGRLKHTLLDVPLHVLQQHGEVSEQVVCAMTQGALHVATHATVAVAVSGIAGPGGGSAQKPAGTVWIAWQIRAREAHAHRFHFHGERDLVRRQSIRAALEGVCTLGKNEKLCFNAH